MTRINLSQLPERFAKKILKQIATEPVNKEKLQEPKKAKYNNKKVYFDGIYFDSIVESRRYRDLKLLERAGEIRNLKVQPKYELQEKFKSKEKKHYAITYTPDFEYEEKRILGWIKVAEDVKGWDKKKEKFITTDTFKLKEKLFRYKYPEIDFRIVRGD